MPAAAATNLLANPGFESGNLSGWTCSATDGVTSSTVHSGSYALAGAASSSDDAQCSQKVSVQPSSSYSLSGYVEGAYVFIGDSGTGSSDTENWTPGTSGWQQLSTSFTTGALTTGVTICVHGWCGQGTYYADDLALTGATGSGGGGGVGGSVPAAPTGLAVTGTKATSTTGTSATISGLAAGTTYTFAVTAYNSAGESAKSGSVQATTASSGGGGGSGSGSYTVAPYVDLTNNQEPMLNTAATSAGLKAFSIAFVTGSGCTPIWGDTLPVTNDPTVTGEITTAEGDGARPIASFGGKAGIELADSCTNLSQLTATYQSVINTLHVSHIDFDIDIEGAEIAYTANNNTRFQAINALEAANPASSCRSRSRSASRKRTNWAGWPSGRWTVTSRAAAAPPAFPSARRSASRRWTSSRSSPPTRADSRRARREEDTARTGHRTRRRAGGAVAGSVDGTAAAGRLTGGGARATAQERSRAHSRSGAGLIAGAEPGS